MSDATIATAARDVAVAASSSAATSADGAADSEAAALAHRTAASGFADAALDSAANADTSADLAAASESNAATSAATATTKAGEASSSATAAAASAAHAGDMAGATEAVAVANDTIIAGRVNDPASATSAALSATIATATTPLQAQIDNYTALGTYQGAWTATTYALKDVVLYSSTLYIATSAATAGDVPGTAALWKALPTTVDTVARAATPQTVTEFDTSVLVAVRDAAGHRTWLEAAKSDGGPTSFATDAVRTALDAQRTTTDDPETLVSVRDASNHRTWLEARKSDGGPSRAAAAHVRAALMTPHIPWLTYVADGDSLTGIASGGGTTYPAKLSALLGKTVLNTGVSGAVAQEIGMWAGGLCWKVSVTGGSIPASTTAACTVTLLDGNAIGLTANRTFYATIQGIPCVLTYTLVGTSWTVQRVTAAGAATKVPSSVVAIPTVATLGPDYVHIVWAGRNNSPKSSAQQPILDVCAHYRNTRTPFLLVSITNTTSETAGTSGYDDIKAVNDAWRAAYPREYVPLRSRLISEGLDLAGLTATGTDTTDIANDCIPTSLLADGLHMNDNGRVAVAAIIKDELTIRGLA